MVVLSSLAASTEPQFGWSHKPQSLTTTGRNNNEGADREKEGKQTDELVSMKLNNRYGANRMRVKRVRNASV